MLDVTGAVHRSTQGYTFICATIQINWYTPGNSGDVLPPLLMICN